MLSIDICAINEEIHSSYYKTMASITKRLHFFKKPNTSCFQYHVTLGWAGPMPQTSHVVAPRFSMGSGHRQHSLSGFQRWVDKRTRTTGTICKKEDVWREKGVGVASGGRHRLGAGLKDCPKPCSSHVPGKNSGGKWISQQSSLFAGLE